MRSRAAELQFRELSLVLLAIGVLVLISVGRVHDHIGLIAVFRPGLTLTALCFVAAVVRPSALSVGPALRAWPTRGMIAVVASAVLASFFGLSLGASGNFMITYMLPVLVLFFLIALAVRNENDLRWIALAYVAAVIAVGMASIFLSEPMHFDGYTRQGGVGMYDGNDIGVVFMVGLPLAVVFLRSRDRVLQLVAIGAACLALIALVLTASRGGLIGLAVGGLAMVVLSPGWNIPKKLAAIAVPVVAMVLFAPDGYWDQMSSILHPQDDYNLTSDTGRIAIWTRALGYIAQYPIFGIGPNNFLRAGWFISDVGSSGLVGAVIMDQAPHNTFIQVWTELGTVGLLIWLTLIGGGVIVPLQFRKRFPRRWLEKGTADQRFLYLMASYLPASFLGFSATAFFVSHAYTPIFYALMGILAGFVKVSRRELRRERLRTATSHAVPPTQMGPVTQAPATHPSIAWSRRS
jgi:O-antigen ligase